MIRYLQLCKTQRIIFREIDKKKTRKERVQETQRGGESRVQSTEIWHERERERETHTHRKRES